MSCRSIPRKIKLKQTFKSHKRTRGARQILSEDEDDGEHLDESLLNEALDRAEQRQSHNPDPDYDEFDMDAH